MKRQDSRKGHPALLAQAGAKNARGGELDSIWVRCSCGAKRSMSQAAKMSSGSLGLYNGSRPWLGARKNERCGEPNRLLIRTASNAYFSQCLSVSVSRFLCPTARY